jgi:hypothetical protein
MAAVGKKIGMIHKPHKNIGTGFCTHLKLTLESNCRSPGPKFEKRRKQKRKICRRQGPNTRD